MGLAATQCNMRGLIGEEHDKNYRLLRLTAKQRTLANQMQFVSQKYQKALTAKRLQYVPKNSIAEIDLNYNTLMRPNSFNMTSPKMITNFDGKIVIDGKYRKYAEMISSTGVSCDSWGGDLRTSILAELTGISEEDIDNADSTSSLRKAADSKLSDEENAYDEWLDREERKAKTQYLTVDDLAKNMGKTTGGVDLSKMYKNNEDLVFTSESSLKGYIENIKNNMSKYFIDDDLIGCTDNTKFKEACDKTYELYETAIKEGNLNGDVKKAEIDAMGLAKLDVGYKVNVQDLFKMIMDNYSGTSKSKTSNNDQKTYAFRDITTSSWDSWYKELENRYSAVQNASDVFESTVETANMAMTADQESLIKYYDNLFTAIADNGWVYDSQIDDADYLNQSFLNNTYYLTTMSKNTCYDPEKPKSPNNWEYSYDSSLASNDENIVAVNDDKAMALAQAEYENEKRKINDQEQRIDLEKKNIQTDLDAIKQMKESLKNISKQNIERTFNLWS